MVDAVPHPDVLPVIVAALAVALPCPFCGLHTGCSHSDSPDGWSPTTARAKLVQAALLERGLVRHTVPKVTSGEVEETARWLADRSQHPRYTQTDEGWRKLLQSVPDVDLAYTHAARTGPQVDQEPLARARALLIAAVAANGGEDRR